MAIEIDESIGGFDPEVARRLQAAGHELIPGRRTYRHAAYRHKLHPDQPLFEMVGSERVPLLDMNGRHLTVSNLLPERVDLAFDDEGTMINQADFTERWVGFLDNTMLYGEAHAEPIPNVARFAMLVPDTFSESPGMVAVGYDAKKPPEEDTTTMKMSADQEAKDALVMKSLETLLEKATRGPGRPPKDKD